MSVNVDEDGGKGESGKKLGRAVDTTPLTVHDSLHRESSVSLRRVVLHVRQQYQQLSTKELAFISWLLLLLYASSAILFFGQNFWMWSFKRGNPRYVGLILPSACWAVMFVTPLVVYQARQGYRWKDLAHLVLNRRFAVMLVAIGFLDSLGGLTSIYSVMNVPVLLQTVLTSSGPIWTYVVSFVAYPTSVRRFNPLMVVVLLLIAGSVALALVPQLDVKNDVDLQAGWVVIFLLSVIFPPTYNVIQGRFLSEFTPTAASAAHGKLVLLAVDTSLQLLFTLLYFPLDAVPWFGSSGTLQGSWDGMVEGIKCIGSCQDNLIYFVMYVFGFWLNHVVFAYLNYYSPTVGSLLSQLSSPINSFLLILFPAWNVFGAPVSLRYNVGCFVMLTCSMVVYIVWHIGTEGEAGAQLDDRRRECDVPPLPVGDGDDDYDVDGKVEC